MPDPKILFRKEGRLTSQLLAVLGLELCCFLALLCRHPCPLLRLHVHEPMESNLLRLVELIAGFHQGFDFRLAAPEPALFH